MTEVESSIHRKVSCRTIKLKQIYGRATAVGELEEREFDGKEWPNQMLWC